MVTDRQHVHQLLDQLNSSQLAAVIHLLEVMTSPLAHSLAMVPVEEEDLTAETAAALEHSCASFARDEGIPHEEMRREFGLEATATELPVWRLGEVGPLHRRDIYDDVH